MDINRATTSKYDLFNRNGAPLCHAVGCRKHKNLYEQYRGLFCLQHLNELSEIRQRITHDTSSIEKLECAVRARREEALFRKVMECCHMHYLLQLETRLQQAQEGRFSLNH